MSDSELDETPANYGFDSEADFLEISSINSTPQLGVNAGQFPITPPNTMALGNEDGIMTGLVSNRGNHRLDP